MLDAEEFLADLSALGVERFFGVPDSLLSSLIVGLETRAAHGRCRFEVTADEGAAVGLAIGSYLGSKVPAAVFMQNSGLGNAVNPLTSLAHDKVYGIPMLLLVGWRGEMTAEGQLKDEPQHVFQGEITCSMLELLDVPYAVIGTDDEAEGVRKQVADLLSLSELQSKPVALVIRKNTFAPAQKPVDQQTTLPTREDAIKTALDALGATPVVATTGKISREVYEIQQANSIGGPSFLSVGGMGHAVMIATGLAMSIPGHKVACFDGDGAVLMHAGSLATSARQDNLVHIVFNNRVHDSVGGQTTAGPDATLSDLATALGYGSAVRLTSLEEIRPALSRALASSHASLLEIMVAPGARSNLGRPKATPSNSKLAFMDMLGPRND
ncbi:phosphonopyruvate decarboxylase [Shimia aestuarii]|uniref:phosphonopyruvate decarboxylase n=1 Tax=Shimia aestuarii TaxID=254406 RepID=UPI001FB3257D|nr:phosphonopyruvate decarboxylase [Shimia aestuarii]